MTKASDLLALTKLRQRTRYPGFKCIGDYYDGVYECDFVSPYSKSACNIDAEVVVVMLQDWASDEALSGPIHEPSVTLGHDPTLPTKRNLKRLLRNTFDLTLHDVYGTNLFPFVKLGGMSASIPQKDLVKAARDFALPQVQLVQPKLVICLGLVTFNAFRKACELSTLGTLADAIDNPFNLGNIRIWCQAHTGAFGQNNRNRGGVDRVTGDWGRMKADIYR